MTKVPPSSRPPSRPPSRQPSPSSSTQRPSSRRAGRDNAPQKVKAIKVIQPAGIKGVHGGGVGEEGGESEAGEITHSGIHDPHEEMAAHSALQLENAEDAAMEEAKELREEAREAEEREEGVHQAGDADPGEKQHAQNDKRPSASAAAGSKSGSAKSQQPSVKPEELNDGFGNTRMDALREGLNKLEQSQRLAMQNRPALAPPPIRRPGTDALSALNSAQDPGIYFKVLPDGGGGGEGAPEDPDAAELRAAVEEAARQLADVKGIQRVGPGENDEGAKVVVVVADRGFNQASLGRIPERFHRFDTLLAIPYDLLPLRRADV